jgi:methylated-DNA-[protein]-cysteine S-methyltransferase
VNPVRVWSDRVEHPDVGGVRVWATDAGVRRIDFRAEPAPTRPGELLSGDPPPPHLAQAIEQLREYLAGERRAFDLPLDMSAATPFQRRVYERLLQIPWGQVATYRRVARDIGAEPATARAVGQAVGANPIAIVVPCHRVVATDGRLVGFGGGLERKVALLRLEGIDVDGVRPSSRVHPEIIRLPI